ncbi:MAG: hypothetical protein E7176_06335 [Erysipelotrichaceae bacterium]|nr:hypothetical protein [Erysipelotrichaceae bacterium]
MDIYTDYGNWKFENHEFINELVKNKSKTISRFTPVIAVVDYLYDKVVDNKSLSQDEEVIFSTGFDYIYDQFHLIKTLLELKFNNNYKELEKYAQTINLLLYINDFQSEALNYPSLKDDIKKLDDLEDKVNTCLDKKENAPDAYFQILNEITDTLFNQNNIEVHTVDQIFYEIALEYEIYEDEEFDIYNAVLNKQIDKTRSKA